MNFLPLLEKKRDGQSLLPVQIEEIVAAFVAGQIPDYQMSAFLMATYFRGLNGDELRALTLSMRDSGEKLRFARDDARPVADKHSTGGVGDKVSLPLAPLLACLGFRVPMISGRGLGITGGTLDKLESIPGFQTQLSPPEIERIVEETGCAIVGQTENMVPADRLLYALRDVTATVPSIPLITASILSKKLAEDLDALVLDVKWGRAAFMQTREDAQKLADTMSALGKDCGVRVRATLNEMNAPLGKTAGNWLEVVESVKCLEGRGPRDLEDLVVECAAILLEATGKSQSLEAGREAAKACLQSGAPREKWNEMLRAQGADLRAFEEKLRAPSPCFRWPIESEWEGEIEHVDARALGEIVRDLGGGRLTKESVLNPDVGLSDLKSRGERVEKGEVLGVIWARDEKEARSQSEKAREAFGFGRYENLRQPKLRAR